MAAGCGCMTMQLRHSNRQTCHEVSHPPWITINDAWGYRIKNSRHIMPRHGSAKTSECRRGSPDSEGPSRRYDPPTAKPAKKTGWVAPAAGRGPIEECRSHM